MPNQDPLSKVNEPVRTDIARFAQLVAFYTFQLREPNGNKFEPDQNDITLVLNPQSLTRTQAAKNAVTETQTGRWVDQLGLAGPRWSMQGHFGFKKKFKPFTTDITDGYVAFFDFFRMVQRYFDENRDRALQTPGTTDLLQMWFFDWEDGDFWQIEPDGLPEKSRNQNRPVIREYSFNFIGIRDLTRDSDRSTTDEIATTLNNRAKRMVGLEGSLTRQLARLAGTLDPEIEAELAGDGLATNLANEAKTEGWSDTVIQTIADTTAWITKTKGTYTEKVNSSISEVQDIADQIDAANAELEGLERATDPRFLTADLIDTFNQVNCGIGALLTFPEAFSESYVEKLDAIRGQFRNSGCSSTLVNSDPSLR